MKSRAASSESADSPVSFRAASEANVVRKPLHLRSPPPSPPITPHTRPSLLHRSASLPGSTRGSEDTDPASRSATTSLSSAAAVASASKAADRTRRRGSSYSSSRGRGASQTEGDDAGQSGQQHHHQQQQQQLYRPEVRSCGHPQPLYLKVPLGAGRTTSTTTATTTPAMYTTSADPSPTATAMKAMSLPDSSPEERIARPVGRSEAAAEQEDDKSGAYATESARVSAATELLADQALRSPPILTPKPVRSVAEGEGKVEGRGSSSTAGEDIHPPPVALAATREKQVSQRKRQPSLPSSVPLSRFQHLLAAASSDTSASSSSVVESLLISDPPGTARTVGVDPALIEHTGTETVEAAPAAAATMSTHHRHVGVPTSSSALVPLRRAASADEVVGAAPFISVNNVGERSLGDDATYSQATSLPDWAAEVTHAASASANGGEGGSGVPLSKPHESPMHSDDSEGSSHGAGNAVHASEAVVVLSSSWDAVAADVEELSDRDLVEAEEDDVETAVSEVEEMAVVDAQEPTTTANAITTAAAATAALRQYLEAAALSTRDELASHPSLSSSSVSTLLPTSNRLAAYQNSVEVLSLASPASLGVNSPLYASSPHDAFPLLQHTAARESAYAIQHSTKEEELVGFTRGLSAKGDDLAGAHGPPISDYPIQHSDDDDTAALERAAAAAGFSALGRTTTNPQKGSPSAHRIHHSPTKVFGGMLADLVRGVGHNLPEDAFDALGALGGDRSAAHPPTVVAVEEVKIKSEETTAEVTHFHDREGSDAARRMEEVTSDNINAEDVVLPREERADEAATAATAVATATPRGPSSTTVSGPGSPVEAATTAATEEGGEGGPAPLPTTTTTTTKITTTVSDNADDVAAPLSHSAEPTPAISLEVSRRAGGVSEDDSGDCRDVRPLPIWAASSRTSSGVMSHAPQPATRGPSGLDMAGRRRGLRNDEAPPHPPIASSSSSSSGFGAPHVVLVSRSPTRDDEVLVGARAAAPAAVPVVAELAVSDAMEEAEVMQTSTSTSASSSSSLVVVMEEPVHEDGQAQVVGAATEEDDDSSADLIEGVTAVPLEVPGDLRQKRTPIALPPPPQEEQAPFSLLDTLFVTTRSAEGIENTREETEEETMAERPDDAVAAVALLAETTPSDELPLWEEGDILRGTLSERAARPATKDAGAVHSAHFCTDAAPILPPPTPSPPPRQDQSTAARPVGVVGAWTRVAPAPSASSPMHNLLDAVRPSTAFPHAAHRGSGDSSNSDNRIYLGGLPRRPLVARDLLEDVEELSDVVDAASEEEEGAAHNHSPALPSSSGLAPAPTTAMFDFDLLVRRRREAAAASDLAVLVALELEGRRTVMADMLAGRASALFEEAASYSVLTVTTHRGASDTSPPPPLSQVAATSSSTTVPSSGATPRMPPSPPAPTSRQEVQTLLRTRGVAGSFGRRSSGLLSAAAVLTDELLHREVIEDDEVHRRTMLRRLRQCELDALTPSSVYMQETLAWQRLSEAARVERQRIHALDLTVNEEVADLLNIGREVALCCMMEEEERHEVVERAEHAGRQRLYELHWSGLAVRLRQSALLHTARDVALANALDDVIFEETQTREEVRVAAIREWTVLAESVSGAAVREAHARRRQPQQIASRPAVAARGALKLTTETAAPAAAAKESLEEEEVVALSASSSSSSSSESSSVSISVCSLSRDDGHLHDHAHHNVLSAAAATNAAAVLGEPHVFQWDPTSNSNPTPHGSAGHPSQQRQHTSTSSPSPHLTNMTTLTTTATTTTPSSSALVSGSVDVTRILLQQLEQGKAKSSSTQSRRSPTLVLPTQAQLQAQEGIGPAEASALLHALQCTEAAVRQQTRRHHSTTKQATHKKEEELPADDRLRHKHHHHHQQLTEQMVQPAEEWDEAQVAVREEAAAPNASATAPMQAATQAQHPSRRSPLFLTRHSVPCSLRRSPAKAYHALLHRYTSPIAQCEAPVGAARVLTSPSPSSSVSTSPRRYRDGDVYAVDTNCPRGPDVTRVRSSERLRVPPWDRRDVSERLLEMPAVHTGTEEEEEVAGDEAAALSATPATPAREVFPGRHHDSFHADASLPERSPRGVFPFSQQRGPTSPARVFASLLLGPATPSSPVTRPTLVEVVSSTCVPSAAVDVSLSPLSTNRNPSRPRPPLSYAASTAAWSTQVEARQLDQMRRSLLFGGNTENTGSSGEDVSLAPGGRSSVSGGDRNAAQCGCSCRRPQEAASPLLITRLPFGEGPGVWPSPLHPRDAPPHSRPATTVGGTASPYTSPQPQRHVLATTSPGPPVRHAETLAEAVAYAKRSREVVHLPTTVAELLRGPQHMRVSVSQLHALHADGGTRGDDQARGREEEGRRRAQGDRPAQLITPASPPVQPARVAYNYVDVFYKQPHLLPSPRPLQQRGPAVVETPNTKAKGRRLNGSAPPTSQVAARCAAVDQCERQHEFRALLRQPSASATAVRTTRMCSSQEQEEGEMQTSTPNLVTEQQKSSSNRASALSVIMDDNDAAECFFDDGDVTLCSALANRVKRERGATRHSHRSSSQSAAPPSAPRKSAVSPSTRQAVGVHRISDVRGAPQRSPPKTPLVSPVDTQTFGRHIPPGYRVLLAPSPSYLQVRTPSRPRHQHAQQQQQRAPPVFMSPTTERVVAAQRSCGGVTSITTPTLGGRGGRWQAAPSPSTPAQSPIGAVSLLRSSYDLQRSQLDKSELPASPAGGLSSQHSRTNVW